MSRRLHPNAVPPIAPPLSIGSGGASIPVSVALPNLAAHTTYHYRIRAMNVEGTITTDDLTFATLDTAPIAMNDRFTAPGNAPFNVLPVANDVDPDGDALVIDSVASGAFGRTSFSGNMVTYSPGVQGLRADQFQYTINDEFGGTSSASVTIEMPLAPFKGSYSHLLTGQSGLAGRIDLVMGGVGGFTATVMLGDERHALRGRFGSDGFARVVEHRQRASDLVLTLDLRLTSGGPRVTGALTDGINTWEIDVGGVLYDAGSRPFGSGARFTLVVGDSGLETMPRGDGWAIIKGSNDGHLRFGGAFADGSSFVAAALVYPDGSIPTYILRRRKPTQWLSGTLQLSGSAGAEAIDGEFAWTRPSEGFTATSIVRGSRFQRPLDANGMFVFANPARPRLLATLGGLAPDADIRHDLSARLGRLFVDDPNGDRFRMRFSRTTGRYTGGIIHPALGSARIGGVLLQRDNVVRGSFYGSGFGGAFRIEPR